MKIIILGLSITSSWGNGHATTYRSLVRELVRRGHEVLFLERDMPWYAENRDLPHLPYGRIELYSSVSDLDWRFASDVRNADVVIVGSYVPDGVAVGEWVIETATRVTVFYDIDTPITLAKLGRGDYEYVSPELIPRYQLYLSFTGGPTLQQVERELGAPAARVLYCSVDPSLYYPEPADPRWDLGYLGTYCQDRQRLLDGLMLEPARRRSHARFVVAGPLYPATLQWPANVQRVEHLPPAEHRSFYNSQRATLNLTRAEMLRAGYSPSVRLFEAAACGTPIITDEWDGLDTIFQPGEDILVARCSEDMIRYLYQTPGAELARIGERGRARVLSEHSAHHRASELETYIGQVLSNYARA